IVFALPAASVPPTSVTRTSWRDGRPRWASSMAGTVVTRSSSMMRGLVSATRARTTTPAWRRPPSGDPGRPGSRVSGTPEPAITPCTPGTLCTSDPFLLPARRPGLIQPDLVLQSVEQKPGQCGHQGRYYPPAGWRPAARPRTAVPNRHLSVRGRFSGQRPGRDIAGGKLAGTDLAGARRGRSRGWQTGTKAMTATDGT